MTELGNNATLSPSVREQSRRVKHPKHPQTPRISQPHVINLPRDAPTSLLGWKQYLLGPQRVNYEVKMIDDVIEANRA